MEDRLKRLESAVDALAASLEKLEARISAIEETAPMPAEERAYSAGKDLRGAAGPETEEAEGFAPAKLLSAMGRSFLVLGGAFLLRVFTDEGLIPQVTGVAIGLAYAAFWILCADRAGRRALLLSATFHGLSALLIAYPIIWEATTKLGVLSPHAAVAVMALLTGIGFFAARRRDLRIVAGAFTLAALATTVGLIFTTGVIELFTAFILALGAVSVWLAYDRRWHIVRWVVAFGADVIVLLMIYLVAGSGETSRLFAHISIPYAMVVSASLPVVYLGSFALRTLLQNKNVTVFEVIQSAFALLVGFGGAVHISQSTGSGGTALGAASLVAAAASYVAAFTSVQRRQGRGRNFLFYTWLAFVFTILGTGLVASGGMLALVWGILAIAAALLGGRFDHVTLRIHSALFAAAAFWHAGLAASVMTAFVTPAARSWELMPPLSLAVLALTLTCYMLLVATQKGREVTRLNRLPRFAVVVLAVLGCGSLAVFACIHVATASGGTADPAEVAIIRTAVLALSAVVLAAAGRKASLPEQAWLVYPFLVAGGVKLVFEDLRCGSAKTLFLGFVYYGIALIIAPRLLRRGRKKVGTRSLIGR